MGKITALRQQARNPGRVNLFIDDEFCLGITNVLAAQLRFGQELSENEVQALTDLEAHEVAYRRALDYISRRPHAREEIRRKLRRRDTKEDVIEGVIERLEASQYLDDTSFAEAWVENRMLFRPRGRKTLRQELRMKGVSNEIIEEALLNVDDENAMQLALEKALPRYQKLPREVAERRLLAYMARRGFSYGPSRKVIREALDVALVSVEESEAET